LKQASRPGVAASSQLLVKVVSNPATSSSKTQNFFSRTSTSISHKDGSYGVSRGAGQSPDYVQVANTQVRDLISTSDVQFRGYISLGDARVLHQNSNLFVEDHFNPNQHASDGLVKCVARLTHASLLTAEYSMVVHRDGYYVNTCIPTGKTIWRPVWKGTGKYSPARASHSAYNAANRGANQLIRLAEINPASKHCASHIRYYELTFPKELSRDYGRMGRPGRRRAWNILKKFLKIRTKRRCRDNQQMGQKVRLHTWISYNPKHPQFPSPHDPHFHFHITEVNVVLERIKNPPEGEPNWLFHRESPWDDVRLIKEDWKKAIESKTFYRFKEDQLPVCFLHFDALADRERIVFREKYRNRHPIEDLNNWYWHWGSHKSKYIWRESFTLELLNWKEHTRNYGFMTRINQYLPEKTPEKICPFDGGELEYETVRVQEDFLLTTEIYDGMPVLVREPGKDRYLLFMAPDQKCILEQEGLNAVKPA